MNDVPELLAPHEAGPYGYGRIGSEGDETITSGPPTAGGTVLDPEQRPWKLRQAFGKVPPDDLSRQVLGQLGDEYPTVPQLLADDYRCVAFFAPIHPHPTATGTEAVTLAVVDVLGGEDHPGRCPEGD
jgi:hypothetical protein